MSVPAFDERYSGNPAENYERYFVPTIAAPLGDDLIVAAALQPGERILDVACGTGILARLAAERVGPSGRVAGSDVHPAMLAVARSAAPPGAEIDWYETNAEAMPLPDESFDVVLCQMGLQFFSDKAAALREMRRVLVPGGRLVVNVPGPTPPMFTAFAEALARHVDPQTGAFVEVVFGMHDADELERLMHDAGLGEVTVNQAEKTLPLPAAEEFLWQYVHSTPLAGPVAGADPEQLAAVEKETCEDWNQHVVDGTLTLRLQVTTAVGHR
jgi:ubiquinone/menaquinone biosynthesis C-methylase UbiE